MTKIKLIRMFVPESIDMYLIHLAIQILEKNHEDRLLGQLSCDSEKKKDVSLTLRRAVQVSREAREK